MRRRSKYNTALRKQDKPKAFGHVFDSTLEKQRYLYLRELLERGEISDLKVHPRFQLCTAFENTGHTYRGARVTFDFQYQRIGGGKPTIEDVKSKPTQTEAFMVRLKWWMSKYGHLYRFRIVKSPTEPIK